MKYRLKIPEMINKRDAIIAADFETVDEVIEFGGPTDNRPGYLCVEARGGIIAPVPKDWLEEIKDDPVSAEGYIKNGIYPPPNCISAFHSDIKKAFKAGEENQKLRHRPQQSFDEWFDSDMAEFQYGINKGDANTVWKAHAKATNTEP